MGLDLTSKKTLNVILGIVVALSLIIGVCTAIQKTDSSSDKEEHAYKVTALICSWSVFGLGAIILGIQIYNWAMKKSQSILTSTPTVMNNVTAPVAPML